MSICQDSIPAKCSSSSSTARRMRNFRLLLIAQCNALHKALPFLFEAIDDETELLLPDHLLHSDSLIRKLVEESLGTKKSETSRDTIRRYLANDFYKQHLSMYKKRPIYWLLSSGKQGGFQALVYLHRYNQGTLARMRTEYVIPLLGKMTARISHLTDDSTAATSSQHKKRLEAEMATITKQLAEARRSTSSFGTVPTSGSSSTSTTA